jgi:protein involved in polysaccharide export with SLBB domain
MTLKHLFLGLALIAGVVGDAAAVGQETAATTPAAMVSHAGAADAVPQLGYRLDVADKVRLIVYNEPTLSGEFTVNSDGVLSVPLIGDVKVRGLTTAESITAITEKFADGYLRDPKVSIDVLTYRPFYILGEVTKPGEYPYSNGLTVMNAVATASGFTYRANKGNIFIKHAGEAKENKYKMTPDLVVKPGDTVRVGERYF